MNTSLHPALRAQIDEAMSLHERRTLSQAEIDVPPPTLGGGLVYGADDRPIPIPWRRVRAALLAVGALVASAACGFLLGIALGLVWEAVTR
jgi:hypothetical protein